MQTVSNIVARTGRKVVDAGFIIVVAGSAGKRETRSTSRDGAVYYHDEGEKLLEDN
jgi:hypothetical protein